MPVGAGLFIASSWQIVELELELDGGGRDISPPFSQGLVLNIEQVFY